LTDGKVFVKILKAKLHGATVTNARVDYTGSIGIDADLMRAVGILPYEAVLVANITNGSRFETYAVEAEAGSGRFEVLGAAAHLARRGDRIIVFGFAYCTGEEAEKAKPKVLVLDEANRAVPPGGTM
jgi:aspartate 1-decarboxylase